MRIAFLTPEYPSEHPDGGGLGTYIHRMAKLLIESGHEPEIFVASQKASETLNYNGVQIHRIHWKRDYEVLHAISKLIRLPVCRKLAEWLFQAWALSAALDRRHAIDPFHLVQSADYQATGLLVSRHPGRVHAVRCSSAADLYNNFDKIISVVEKCRAFLERMAVKRADVAYAPSRYIADYFKRVHHIDVKVVRPPIYPEMPNSLEPPIHLPERYFLHFGTLMERKGTDVLARALPLAWEEAPDLAMIWSGRCWDKNKLAQWQSLWGDRIKQVQITGPFIRPDLYAVLKRAEAAVLPSQVDNLPNTVIESLMFGIPVLGSRGASIDELVEEGNTGHLVALGDVVGLANTLAAMWLRRTPVQKGFRWKGHIADEMQPERAVANLLALVKVAG
jgi:glycosyltransferase involved in cell wall biosynthesis